MLERGREERFHNLVSSQWWRSEIRQILGLVCRIVEHLGDFVLLKLPLVDKIKETKNPSSCSPSTFEVPTQLLLDLGKLIMSGWFGTRKKMRKMNRKDKGTTQQGSPGAKHFSICGKSGFSYCIWVEKNKKPLKNGQ